MENDGNNNRQELRDAAHLIDTVKSTLEAWTDTARIRLQNALPQDERPYKNTISNYTALIDTLTAADKHINNYLEVNSL